MFIVPFMDTNHKFIIQQYLTCVVNSGGLVCVCVFMGIYVYRLPLARSSICGRTTSTEPCASTFYIHCTIALKSF